MSIENRRQLANTRIKLQELEKLDAKIRHEPATGGGQFLNNRLERLDLVARIIFFSWRSFRAFQVPPMV